MTKVAYLLHRFPARTDTFIKREIRALQSAGTSVSVISVWKPNRDETTDAILSDWRADTAFLISGSGLSLAILILKFVAQRPLIVSSTALLAYKLSRPGLRGMVYQLLYFLEAILAAHHLVESGVEHVHNHIGDQSGTVTMLAAKLADISYSITFHGWPVFFDATYSRIKEKVMGAAFTRSISFFCRSQLMMFSNSVDPSSFKVVHCALELDKYQYRRPRKDVKTLFCAARLSPEKGLTFAITALSILTDRGYDLELHLAGGGPSQKLLERTAEQLGVRHRVRFLGYLSEDEVIEHLTRADIFILPSFVEGLPVSAMEAMAVGVPVIATNIAGTSELVEPNRTGILVRPSDAQSLSDAAVKLISDHDLRIALSEAARRKVEDEFNITVETARLNEHLVAATNSPRRNLQE